ncbi:MAG TPA: hypothetical protein VIJ94_15920 [Caulobacteraceae bacterium]
MARSIGRAQVGAGIGAAALALSATGAPAFAVHLPGRHVKAAVAANEGPWFVRAGATQDIYANTGKKALSLQAYICTRPEGAGAPRVELEVQGRAPIEIQGCSSVYLLLSSGERMALYNPGAADVTGSYKFDLQSQVK